MRRAIADQNPWHSAGRVPDMLAPPVERSLAQHLWKQVLHGRLLRSHVILGPRRVGKTTVMYQTVKRLLANEVALGKIWWLRLDHPLLLPERLDNLVRATIALAGASVESPAYLFLDEIVYAKDWDLWLKTFADEHWPVRIVATSSATAALHDRRLESGVGRWAEYVLTPYLFSEYLDLRGAGVAVELQPTFAQTLAFLSPALGNADDLDASRAFFLLTGGFPELLSALLKEWPHNAETLEQWAFRSQEVLRADAVERALYKDIPQTFGLDNPMMLERLLYVLAGQITGRLSPTTLCGELGISQPTFDKYLSYLERAFLVFSLPNFSGREITVQKRGRKLYFLDGAVRNAALLRGVAPLTEPVEQGLLRENLVASTLHALAVQTGVRLFHWHDRGSEIDFVYDDPNEPVAIEVASSPGHHRKGLAALAERHPKFRGRCYVTSPGAPLMRPSAGSSGIGTLPLDLLLVAGGRFAERALLRRIE